MNWNDNIASALLGVFFSQVPYLYKKTRTSINLPALRKFWSFLSEETHIFLSVTTNDNTTDAFGSYRDMLAASKILIAASEYFGTTQNIKMHDNYEDYNSVRTNNLVILGGGKYNLAYRDIINCINPPLHYFDFDSTGDVADRKNIKNSQNSVIYSPEYDDSGNLQSDLGLIIRAQNPHNKTKQVVIAAGGHAWGTLASVDFLLDPSSVKILKNYLAQNLEIAIRAHVSGNAVKSHQRLSEVLTW